uniref:HIT domain-containing protein n=1 Tax=Eutreptiella gymnastica TaxID=73025 RepID=A0A7S4FW23_9EUGL
MAGIFEKIVAGQIPSHKIYEDDLVYAFLDINPVAPGHTLVIPKKCYEFLHQVPEDTSAAIGRVLPKLAKAVMDATGIPDYNILQNNGSKAHQAVPHVHFHIIPKPSNEQGLGVGWPAGKLEDGEGLKAKIIEKLQ